MEESLRWWWSYYLSKKDIEKMRKNMKKVPVIQKKSEIYHKNQDKEAESFIDNSLENEVLKQSDTTTNGNNNERLDEIWWWNKLANKFKNLIFKKSNGN